MNSVQSLVEAASSASAQTQQTQLPLPEPQPPSPHQERRASSVSPRSAPTLPPVPLSSPQPPPPPAPPLSTIQPQASTSISLSRPDETPPRHVLYPSSASHLIQTGSPPFRKDTSSSISTQATTATLASTETSNSSYSADTSPSLHQSIFSVEDGASVSNSRRPSRRRTGPLSQQSRERAALIRKLGACNDCRRRRVACHPSHHNMTWEDVLSKFHRSHSPSFQDMAAPYMSGRPLSPATPINHSVSMYTHESEDMDVDPTTSTHNQPGRLPLSETRLRTPLPSGPRLEKSLSLPGIESLKNDLQTNASRILSTSNRGRYSAAQVLLLFWQDDDDGAIVENAVRDLADILDKSYHYSTQIQTIPSASDGCKSSWRWLSRRLNDFAEDCDQRDVLKIVYYAGHTYLDGNREMILASSSNVHRASTVRWSGLQQILEEASSDTLIVMDAAYYPTTRIVCQRGVIELIAASVSDESFSALDRCAFTRILSEQLATQASRMNPLSAAELHSALLANYARIIHERNPEKETIWTFPAPFHAMMSGNSRLPSIFLSPIYPSSPLRNSFMYESNPQLQLSIKLNDDNIDVDSWNEWLRLMPEGIKDVKVDGPFRPSFR